MRFFDFVSRDTLLAFSEFAISHFGFVGSRIAGRAAGETQCVSDPFTFLDFTEPKPSCRRTINAQKFLSPSKTPNSRIRDSVRPPDRPPTGVWNEQSRESRKDSPSPPPRMSDEGGQQGPATPPFTPFCQRGRPEIPQPAIPQIQALQVRQVRCDVRARCRRSAAPVQLLCCAQARCCARELAATCHSAAVTTAKCLSRFSEYHSTHGCECEEMSPRRSEEKSSPHRKPRGGGRKAWRPPVELGTALTR